MGEVARDGRLQAADPLTRLFHALADPTRRRLLNQLTVGAAKVTDLARPFRMSLPAVSKHLRILEDAGLVSRTVDGRIHRLTLTGAPLRQVETWLDPFRAYWESTLDALQADLGERPGAPDTRRRRGGARHQPTDRKARRRPPRPARG